MSTAQQAMEKAREAMNAIENHERVCAERYGHIRSDVAEIKEWLKRGLLGLILVLGTVAWAFISQKWGL